MQWGLEGLAKGLARRHSARIATVGPGKPFVSIHIVKATLRRPLSVPTFAPLLNPASTALSCQGLHAGSSCPVCRGGPTLEGGDFP